MKFIVAIDGTAASGKGTLAKKTANHFGFKYLDTGILYRVVAYYLKSAEIHSEISKQILGKYVSQNRQIDFPGLVTLRRAILTAYFQFSKYLFRHM